MSPLALLLGLLAILVFCGFITWKYLGQPLTKEQSELMESEIMRHGADMTIIDSAMSSSSDPK